MLKFLKRYAGVIILLITLVCMLIAAGSVTSLEKTWKTIITMDRRYTFAAFACWLVFILSRAYTMRSYLAGQGCQVKMSSSVRASIIGLFYSGITPAASGGQPMQMYQLYKAGVPISLSGSGVCVKFVGYQGMLFLFSAVFLFAQRQFVRGAAGSSMWLVRLGFVINIAVLAAVTMLLINRKIVYRIMRGILTLGTKTHIIKAREEMEKKISESLENYLKSFETLRGRPGFLLRMLLLSGVQVLSYSFIMYFIYRAFRLEGADILQLVGLQLILYQTVSFVPLPGGSGAQEGLFVLLMRSIVPQDSIMGMLLAWRFFTFYLTMLVGAFTVVTGGIASVTLGARERDSI